MFIKTSIFKRILKDAWKGAGLTVGKKEEMNRTKISKPLCKYPDCFRCVYPDCTCNEGLTKKGNDELVRELAKR